MKIDEKWHLSCLIVSPNLGGCDDEVVSRTTEPSVDLGVSVKEVKNDQLLLSAFEATKEKRLNPIRKLPIMDVFLPETNSSHLKNGWFPNRNLIFPFVHFQVRTVSFWGCR